MVKAAGRRKSVFRTQSIGSNIFDGFNIVLMLILAVAMLYPFWEVLVVSFMTAQESIKTGLKLWPKRWVLEAYRIAFSSDLILTSYFNTIFRTVIGTSITVFLSFCTAYPLAKKTLPARTVFTFYVLIPMFFTGGLIPTYLLVRGLGLINTRWALIFPMLLNTYYILIMRNFIMTIPDSLEESAMIDGASFLKILIKIIIPLSTPIMATIALWVAVRHWNSWFDALIYLRDESKIVLQLVLRRVLIEEDATAMADLDEVAGAEAVTAESVKAATVLLSIGPIILVYPFIQRYFVKGIMIGSLKG